MQKQFTKTKNHHHRNSKVTQVILLVLSTVMTSLNYSTVDFHNRELQFSHFVHENEVDFQDGPCKPLVVKCQLCDNDDACTKCEDGLFLDIEEKPFRC